VPSPTQVPAPEDDTQLGQPLPSPAEIVPLGGDGESAGVAAVDEMAPDPTDTPTPVDSEAVGPTRGQRGPAHGLTEALVALYAANRLTVTRQLAYDPANHNTLDLVLLVNGIPTATAELKNPLTNQIRFWTIMLPRAIPKLHAQLIMEFSNE
jgi:Type I restriction enzyme R protein N terminus (HSDR_N)